MTLLRYFNPRAYVRHDAASSFSGRFYAHFNPRAYVRHDRPPGLLAHQVIISIHVPT